MVSKRAIAWTGLWLAIGTAGYAGLANVGKDAEALRQFFAMWMAIALGGFLPSKLMGHFLRRLASGFPWGEEGVKRGEYIGIAERSISALLTLAGAYAAIGLVLTAKSIARFKELRNRNFAEYYLVGTLSSIAWAIFVGMGVRLLLGLRLWP